MFDFIPLEQGSDKAIEQRGLILAENGRKDPTWAFGCIVRVVQFQRSCEQEEDNSRSSTGRIYADDRIPPIGDIRMISEYPDRRIKAIVCTITSTGIVTSSQGLDLAALLTVAFG